eukprot:CAMPEP_0197894792 /NCGR_PEP_ID=MMETSP1439-20131203/36019_1 /TAXON_ID=66791 /ORGANISM="Gonyaulax spinifera, Strain CCMP409" /LENGTH=63 /DNA_ID=CAMNT_0043515175 /DNA_START=60 /DNA_END=247 /DNA_ORIENTATION=-
MAPRRSSAVVLPAAVAAAAAVALLCATSAFVPAPSAAGTMAEQPAAQLRFLQSAGAAAAVAGT